MVMKMTNFERLTQTKSIEEFWETVQELNRNKLAPFIDFPAFFRSEDTELMHFVKAIGEGELLPSETEMIMHGCNTENDKLLYQQMHKTKVMILKKSNVFGGTRLTVCDYLGQSLLSVPANNIAKIKMYENTEH